MSAQTRRGFSIRIFFPDGVPDGRRIIRKDPGLGRAIVCPRTRLKDAKGREDLARPGVYVLLGPPKKGELPIAYVGEADPVYDRLNREYTDKDFWALAIVFTKDEPLNKAHIKYLEARLIRLAQEANRCTLDNDNVPKLPTISEADVAAMETFLDEMLLIYPVLGVTIFEKPASERLLYLKAKGVEARGYRAGEEFIVLAGARAAVETRPGSIGRSLERERDDLKNQRILVPEGEFLVLKKDHAFPSPYRATVVLLGREANALTMWRDESGKTLKDIEVQDDREPAEPVW